MEHSPRAVTCHLCASRPSLSASSLARCWEASSSPTVYSLCPLYMNSQAGIATVFKVHMFFMWAESPGSFTTCVNATLRVGDCHSQ